MALPSLLTPLQKNFLAEFFKQPTGQEFFLTGGTALAEFYLRHRYSEDIDLFTLSDSALHEVSISLPALTLNLGATFEERLRTSSFQQAFIHAPDGENLKIDFVRDVGPQFGNHKIFDGISVDSLLNIAVNKATAIFGRAAGKDFVDLYYLLKQGFDFDELTQLAKQKDPGLTEFYLAGMLRHVRQIKALPNMIQPLDLEVLCVFFERLAEQTVLKIKPPK